MAGMSVDAVLASSSSIILIESKFCKVCSDWFSWISLLSRHAAMTMPGTREFDRDLVLLIPSPRVMEMEFDLDLETEFDRDLDIEAEITNHHQTLL